MNLSNAVALVTGGSGGLGSRICRLLAQEGANVAVAYLGGKERAEAVCDEIRTIGREAMTVQVDQIDPSSIDKGVAQVAAEIGGLDLLVNNAGDEKRIETRLPNALGSCTRQFQHRLADGA